MRTGNVPQYQIDEFGRRLARLRMARNWSQRQVGFKIGCSDRAVAQWEGGERVPGADWLALLAGLYGVSMDALWRGGDGL